MQHQLVKLSGRPSWRHLETVWGEVYTDAQGQPAALADTAAGGIANPELHL
jgi:hypothetical protein